ncbi:MAG: helix-turn-helix domain-containing protein [Corallococcus sp.]|nr:helix-turn-helix domain-containing protein [Corallococcus sp.]MCM1359000.1 helix-turn-helix domain-containing protein [Corallococcus sp.]MCM1394989.1 helix-turn-helix domain-containing protein [Corallococcus sp.]
MEKFRERLKELRTEKGLSQMGLALEIGFGTTAICYWENGVRVPSAEAVIALAKYFGVSADYLLGLED